MSLGARNRAENRQFPESILETLVVLVHRRSVISVALKGIAVEDQDMVWRDDEIILSPCDGDTIEPFLAAHDVKGATRPTIRTEE